MARGCGVSKISFIAIGLSAERRESGCEQLQAIEHLGVDPIGLGWNLTWRIQPCKVQQIKLVVFAEMTCKRAGESWATNTNTHELNAMRRVHTFDVTGTTQNPRSHSVRLQVQAMKDPLKSASAAITQFSVVSLTARTR